MPSPSVEERLAELEKKVAFLLEEQPAQHTPLPWWERHFGAFKDSPDYDEAMRLGAEYRRSQPTAADENNDDILAGL